MDIPKQMRDVREQVIGLLFDRYVFRTHQEIVRRNPQLQGPPRNLFSNWAQVVYAQAGAAGVRRLAGQKPKPDDVSLVGFLNSLIRDPQGLWESFLEHYPADAGRARAILEAEASLQPDWEISACKRLIGEDRGRLISIAEKAVHFASKRVAHSVPDVPVSTTFSDLDEAIETLKTITEKYTGLLLAKRLRELEPLHRAGQATMYLGVLQKLKNLDLLEEMKRYKLPAGWISVFLEAWATPEIIALPLGDMIPPKRSDQ
jgi:hypothetical protein